MQRNPSFALVTCIIVILCLVHPRQSGPDIATISDDVPVNLKVMLISGRKNFELRRDAIRARTDAFTRTCSNAPATAPNCKQERMYLNYLNNTYARDITDFSALVLAANQIKDVPWQAFISSLNHEDKRLAASLNSLVKKFSATAAVSLPVRHVHEGIFLGLFTSQKDADDLLNNEVSPFTTQQYSEMHKSGQALALSFGTGVGEYSGEIGRGLLDHLSLAYESLSRDQGVSIVNSLQGTHFDRLIAHSNGATVAEALIRANVIQVHELNIVGGDRSLINRESLNELLRTGKVDRIEIWINPGDPIPMLTASGASQDVELYRTAEYYLVDSHSNDADSRVGYHLMRGSRYEGRGQKFEIQSHDLRNAYFPNMRIALGHPSPNGPTHLRIVPEVSVGLNGNAN